MLRAPLISCIAGALLCARAHAQPAPTSDEAPVAKPDIVAPEELGARKKSYLYPAGEILLMETALHLAKRLTNTSWAQTSPETIKNNLDPSTWEIDSDGFTVNDAGHPYCGALVFSAARSTGHNWWVSGVYAIGGSAAWELFAEREKPSYNDMISTPLGGMFIGEVMHRASLALLYPGYGKPGLIREAGAAIIDPIGTFNRSTWGNAWTKTRPPSLYAHFGLGMQQASHVIGQHGSGTQFHSQLFFEHGLTGDRAFVPERAMDHFELRASVDANSDDVDFGLNVRGLLLGAGRWSPRIRGMAGLFGAFDFDNQEYVRASMVGVGPGGTAEVQIGRYGYVEGTAAAYAVPWGAAGGIDEREKLGREHHHGPGLAQLVELKAGRRGIASLRSTTRAYEIGGRFAGDDANEVVVRSTVAAEVHVATHHALGLEATYGWRRATEVNAQYMETSTHSTSGEIRAFYAITMDEVLGR